MAEPFRPASAAKGTPSKDTASKDAASKDPAPRRGFFVKAAAIVIGGIVGLFPFLAGLVVFGDPWRRKSAGGEWFLVGSIDSLKAGIPQRVQIVGTRRDAWSQYLDEPIGAVFLVAGPGKTKVEAFNSTCPHAGCSVGFQPAKDCFVCPCHTSAFSLEGQTLNPVSPRNLDSLECEMRSGGEIWVKYQDFLSGTPHKIPKA